MKHLQGLRRIIGVALSPLRNVTSPTATPATFSPTRTCHPAAIVPRARFPYRLVPPLSDLVSLLADKAGVVEPNLYTSSFNKLAFLF